MKDKRELIKNDGQVFTPDYLVKNILNFAGYSGEGILEKHIIDNSCGDGAFLTEILSRYCQVAKTSGYSDSQIKDHLEIYIHGIEIENNAYANLIPNLNEVAANYGITGVSWDMIHTDALLVTRYNGMMDYVVGNPPYVRVHNLNDSYQSVKAFSFTENGMTDLYLVFYELGLRMLNDSGKLCYITPSSWLSSLAGTNFRKYIRRNRNLVGLIDLGHYQPFKATAYTLIALFQKGIKTNTIAYYDYDGDKQARTFISNLSYEQLDIFGNFYLSSPDILEELKLIRSDNHPKYVSVKNGFATLADKVFIGDVPDTSITIPIIKASTGKWYKGLFPYYEDGTPIPELELFSDPLIKEYFNKNKENLQKGRKHFKEWMYYGRTQALKDVCKNKYAINTIIKDKNSIKFNPAPSGAGVYSGLYILTDVSEAILKDILVSDDFVKYISSLKNYKSGGYFSFNSKELEQYINYKLHQYADISYFLPSNQSGISEGALKLF
ncbi:MAG: Eco57I restriction-modification methylase domain-containing protein [Candidatus Cryptobacteroides sp.]|jgi:adenine-specific DNA-methyltransferase